jgi:hypothetical protein
MGLLSLVPTAASANYDAAFTVERFKLLALVAEVAGRQLDLNDVREVPLIHMPSDLGLTAAHLGLSSSRVLCQSTPFARQARASGRHFFECALIEGFLFAPRSVWPRPLSVGTCPTRSTARSSS